MHGAPLSIHSRWLTRKEASDVRGRCAGLMIVGCEHDFVKVWRKVLTGSAKRADQHLRAHTPRSASSPHLLVPLQAYLDDNIGLFFNLGGGDIVNLWTEARVSCSWPRSLRRGLRLASMVNGAVWTTPLCVAGRIALATMTCVLVLRGGLTKGRARSAGAPLGVGPCLTENRAGYAQQTCRVTEPHSGWGPAWVPSLPLNPHFRSTPLTLSSSRTSQRSPTMAASTAATVAINAALDQGAVIGSIQNMCPYVRRGDARDRGG